MTTEVPRASGYFAHLRVGACHMAVPVEDIVQAVDPAPGGLSTLPRREGALVGLLEFGVSVVPVVALERWVELGAPALTADVRVIVLRSGTSLIGIRVDELLGTLRIPASSMRIACHDAGDAELFEAIVPATATQPLLCLLEVARLMALALTWCEAAELKPGRSAAAVARRRATTARYALFTVGVQLWAVPAVAIVRMEPTPPAELRWARQRTCGIGAWGARKVPLVDLAYADTSAPDEGASARRHMAVLVEGAEAIGLVVTRSERMLDLASDDIVTTPGDALLAGTAMVAGMGLVSVLDVGKLFAVIPEASISRAPTSVARHPAAAAPGAGTCASQLAAADGGATPPVSAPRAANSHYLIFDADRSYASPVAGVAGVMALPPSAIDDLTQGRRATIDWRGQTLGVVNLPAIDGGSATNMPRVAVVLEGATPGEGRSAIAIHSLRHWLPARTARRSSMRMHGVGEVDVITPPGVSRNASFVVIDLAQMAYLLA